MEIDTLEGTMEVSPRDFIIRGIKDEIYPCKPDIFEQEYEKVTEAQKDNQNLDFIAEMKRQEGEIERLRAENAGLKHILFENVIAPNCSSCSNRMSKYCDNGIICMQKLLRGEFINFKEKKLQWAVKTLKKDLAETVAREAELIADLKDEHRKTDKLRKEVADIKADNPKFAQWLKSNGIVQGDDGEVECCECETQLELKVIKERVGKRLEVCSQQNGRPECKNCGLSLDDIGGEIRGEK